MLLGSAEITRIPVPVTPSARMTRGALICASMVMLSAVAVLSALETRVMMPAVLLCLCAARVGIAHPVRRRHVALAAVCVSAAVLVHQLAVLAGVALVYLWIMRMRRGEVAPRMLAGFVQSHIAQPLTNGVRIQAGLLLSRLEAPGRRSRKIAPEGSPKHVRAYRTRSATSSRALNRAVRRHDK